MLALGTTHPHTTLTMSSSWRLWWIRFSSNVVILGYRQCGVKSISSNSFLRSADEILSSRRAMELYCNATPFNGVFIVLAFSERMKPA